MWVKNELVCWLWMKTMKNETTPMIWHKRLWLWRTRTTTSTWVLRWPLREHQPIQPQVGRGTTDRVKDKQQYTTETRQKFVQRQKIVTNNKRMINNKNQSAQRNPLPRLLLILTITLLYVPHMIFLQYTGICCSVIEIITLNEQYGQPANNTINLTTWEDLSIEDLLHRIMRCPKYL